MTDLERLRAFCQGVIEEADHMTHEVGEAGARDERIAAAVAKDVIAILDGHAVTMLPKSRRMDPP